MTRTSLFLALLLAAPLASAQGFWDPDGDNGDLCGSPGVECFGMNGMTQAADAVGNELERQAKEDPVKGFIWWLAHKLGPRIPTEPTPPSNPEPSPDPGPSPEPDPAPEPSPDPTAPDEDDDSEETTQAYILGGTKTIGIVREYIGEMNKGERLKLGEYEGDARLVGITQPNRRDDSRYEAAFEIRDGREIYTAYVYANGKGLYLIAPARKKR